MCVVKAHKHILLGFGVVRLCEAVAGVLTPPALLCNEPDVEDESDGDRPWSDSRCECVTSGAGGGKGVDAISSATCSSKSLRSVSAMMKMSDPGRL